MGLDRNFSRARKHQFHACEISINAPGDLNIFSFYFRSVYTCLHMKLISQKHAGSESHSGSEPVAAPPMT